MTVTPRSPLPTSPSPDASAENRAPVIGRRTLLGATALSAFSAVALGACSVSSSEHPRTYASAAPGIGLVIGTTHEPISLVRSSYDSLAALPILRGNCYETLCVRMPDGTFEPSLASSWETSEDGLTWTFHLHPGITFANSVPVSAPVVKWCIEQGTARNSVFAHKFGLQVVGSVDVINDLTLVLNLVRPSRSLLFYLSDLLIVWWNEVAYDTDTSCGPYVITEWVRGDHFTLGQNTVYWGSEQKFGEIIYRFYPDDESMDAALTAGDIDIIALEDSPASLSRYSGDPQWSVSTDGESISKLVWSFNNRTAPLDDVRVRRALYRAIDRQSLLKSIWDGYGQLIGTTVPPSDPWYDASLVDTNAYDPESANSLLAEAGANDLTLSISYVSSPTTDTVVEHLTRDLAAVGVTLTASPTDTENWNLEVHQDSRFQTALGEYGEPRDFLWFADPDSYCGYDNPEVRDLARTGDSAETEAGQTEAYKKINTILARDVPVAPLYLRPTIRVSRAAVTGYPLDDLDGTFVVTDVEIDS